MATNLKYNVFALNRDVDYHEKQISAVIKQLSDLYQACCFPRVVVDAKGHMKDIYYHWPSEQSKKNYDDMQMILGELLKRRYNLK